jgi:hypothetical protein
VNLEKGLGWANQAVAQNNSFATLMVKSNIVKEMGDSVQAAKIMKDGLAIATENELNQYGYQLLGKINLTRPSPF